MAVEIIYETHSVTTDNERGLATGWLPGELSERGRLLAAQMGERHRQNGLAAIFVSDLRRAVETVEVAFAESTIPIFQDARLRECNYGSLNGVSAAHVAAERARHINEPFPGGESYRQVVARVSQFLDDLARDWDGRSVLVVGHSATKWALDFLINGNSLEEIVAAPFEWREGWRYTLSAE